jgi:DNA-binding winged helix-turn-helix (wHTH) protein
MSFTASPRWSRDLPPSASPSDESAGCGEAFSSRAGRGGRSPHRKADTSVTHLRFDRFELDEAEARLICAGEPVALAPKPFAVLCALASARGKLVTKNALRDLVWGHRFVTDAVLKSAISEVRAALDDDPKQPRYIETVWRHGYRFIGTAVSLCTQSQPATERKGVGGPDHPALAALMALCRGDAALADLIRAVAATLERDATLTAFPLNADGSLTNGQ